MVSHGVSGIKTENLLVAQHDRRLGQTGLVVTSLRPGGKARFGEDTLDVITQGEMIEQGNEVKIIDFSGSDAVVISI